jgi:hypothetical protein
MFLLLPMLLVLGLVTPQQVTVLLLVVAIEAAGG